MYYVVKAQRCIPLPPPSLCVHAKCNFISIFQFLMRKILWGICYIRFCFILNFVQANGIGGKTHAKIEFKPDVKSMLIWLIQTLSATTLRQQRMAKHDRNTRNDDKQQRIFHTRKIRGIWLDLIDTTTTVTLSKCQVLCVVRTTNGVLMKNGRIKPLPKEKNVCKCENDSKMFNIWEK